MDIGVSIDSQGRIIDKATGALLRITPEYKVVKFADFVSLEFPDPEYIIEPWLPMRGIALLFAKAGIGKTWVALDIAVSAATARPVLDHWKVPEARRVLYIDGEMDGAEFRDRALTIARSKGITTSEIPLSIMGLSMQAEGMPMIDDMLDQEAIDGACQEADLIIVDNLSSLTRMPENDSESWIPVQQWALRMRAQGRSVLFVHHAGKGGDQRGTSRREDVMNSVVVLKQAEEAEEGRTIFDWIFRKTRGFNGADTASLRIELLDDKETGLVSWDVEPLDGIEKDQLVEHVRDGWTFQDIATELGVSKGTVSKRVKLAVLSGRLSSEEVPKQGRRSNGR